MKDRTPTQVLPNGAIRYEEFNESEVSQGYKYLKLADEPLQTGTALNKAFGDASFFVTFAHARIGTNNELTNADGGENIRFVVSANTEATDAWTVNGTSYTLKDQSGETYEAELKAGAIVSCFADNTNHVLNFKSGGAGLNFALKPYATEAALLADTPKENTIGIVTEAAITDYMFSATQPTTRSDGTALSGGELWIKVGNISAVSFNYFKKNGAMSYPVSSYQYISGSWINKTAKTYQDAAWKDWMVYIILDGELHTEFVSSFILAQNASSVNKVGSELLFISTISGSAMSIGYFSSAETINLTDINTVSISYSDLQMIIPTDLPSERSVTIGFSTTPMGSFAVSNNLKATATGAAGAFSLDVSSLSGDYYMQIKTYAYGNNGKSGTIQIGIITMQLSV